MSVGFRAMRDSEADAVAVLLKMLPKAIGSDQRITVTGESLRKARDVITITVADDSGLIVGVCLWMLTYSSWRSAKGIYVCDLYVMDHMRGKKIGQSLLRAAAREGAKRGCTFIKLEVSLDNPKPAAFYEALSFTRPRKDDLMYLEREDFTIFIEGNI
jgi:GNAT superfamily N-acetyltransferase